MNTFWHDFDEIGLKVALIGSYTAVGVAGCHTGTIQNIGLSRAPSKICVDPKSGAPCCWLASIDPNKPLTYPTPINSWNGVQPPFEAITKLEEYLQTGDNQEKFESSVKETFFSKIVENAGNKSVGIFIISDVINYDAVARNGGVLSVIDRKVTKSLSLSKATLSFKTVDFARYLIDKKIGYVLESPIIQNPNHRIYGNYSLNQVWLWIHPAQLPRSINVASQHGEDKFPSKEDWLKTVQGDIAKKTMYTPKIPRGSTTEELLFVDNRFPQPRPFILIPP